MDDRPLLRVGGVCAIGMGVSYLLVGVLVLLDPTHVAATRADFYAIFSQAPLVRLATYGAFVASALFALGAIPAISGLLAHLHSGLVRWATNLAYLSAGVTALSNVQEISTTVLTAGLLARADAAARQVILATPPTAIDIYGWLRYSGLGFWMLALNLLALRGRALPRPLASLGVVGGALYLLLPWVELLGPSLRELAELVLAVLGGVLVGPLWCIWVGALLLRGPATGTPAR